MLAFIFSSLKNVLTQKHSLCPKEYRGKKIRVKNSLNFFACDIGGGA